MVLIKKLEDALAPADLEGPRKEAFREALEKLSEKDQEELASVFAEMPARIKYLCTNFEDKLVAIGNAARWSDLLAREKRDFEEFSKEL